jgi:hypothetical protein
VPPSLWARRWGWGRRCASRGCMPRHSFWLLHSRYMYTCSCCTLRMGVSARRVFLVVLLLIHSKNERACAPVYRTSTRTYIASGISILLLEFGRTQQLTHSHHSESICKGANSLQGYGCTRADYTQHRNRTRPDPPPQPAMHAAHRHIGGGCAVHPQPAVCTVFTDDERMTTTDSYRTTGSVPSGSGSGFVFSFPIAFTK